MIGTLIYIDAEIIMNCHISFNNTWMRVFRDQDIFKHKAPISEIIQTDGHANWDRSHYDFGHYCSPCLEGRINFKARYPIMLTPKGDKND